MTVYCSGMFSLYNSCIVLYLPTCTQTPENEVDGSALLQLTEELDEFKELVPQAGHRLKIKGLVKKVCNS